MQQLTEEEQRLIEKHHAFYQALCSGERSPNTSEQEHFVAVHKGTAEPESNHERAWVNWISDPAKHKLCSSCSKIIPIARLRHFPDELICAQCKEGLEKPDESDHDLGKCPRCGSNLVWREARNFKAGESFVGCGSFPKCKFKKTGSDALS